jgi:hypothetical protein
MVHAGEQFGMIRDSEDGLLAEARRRVAAGQADFAIVFYAMFIEHRLNGLIVQRWGDIERDDEELVDVLKRNTLNGKTGALWESLFNVPFPPQLRLDILAVARARNEFVHYKWQPVPESWPVGVDEAEDRLMRSAERVVDELEHLERDLEPSVPADVAEWLRSKPAPRP